MMTPRHSVCGTLLFALLSNLPSLGLAEQPTRSNSVVFLANTAQIAGALRIEGRNEPVGSIHYWNRLSDTIAWDWPAAEPGHYRIEVNYSLDPRMTGGEIALVADGERHVAAMAPTTSWSDFKTFDLAVLEVRRAGDQRLELHPIKLPGGPNAALPDIRWLSATRLPASTDSWPSVKSGFRGKPLFDGQTLSGWEGDLTWFRIEGDSIVAGTFNEPIPRNEFLATVEEYEDFEMRLQFRMANPREANGGVQFRSQRIPHDSEMIGYQADIISWKWGALYDESRRQIFLGTALNEEAAGQAARADGWNDYVIRCVGPRIRIWVNGVLTLDYVESDPTVPRRGHIALQIHSGPPSEVAYRDIRLEQL